MSIYIMHWINGFAHGLKINVAANPTTFAMLMTS
jgi:hypothetical protein